jgi:helicase MOV-10
MPFHIGDRILVQMHGGQPGLWYEGGVHVVRKSEVGLRFHASFRGWSKTQQYKIRFKLNRYPLRRQHQALDTAFAQDRLLLPLNARVSILRANNPDLRIRCHNPLIASNPSQLQAVSSIVQQQPGSVPFIVFGP